MKHTTARAAHTTDWIRTNVELYPIYSLRLRSVHTHTARIPLSLKFKEREHRILYSLCSVRVSLYTYQLFVFFFLCLICFCLFRASATHSICRLNHIQHIVVVVNGRSRRRRRRRRFNKICVCLFSRVAFSSVFVCVCVYSRLSNCGLRKTTKNGLCADKQHENSY